MIQYKDFVPIYPCLISEGDEIVLACDRHWDEIVSWLSRNMLPNINTCENGWSNFAVNLRVVSLKLLKFTQFTWPNISIYFNFLCAVPLDDVIESTRYLMRPPVIIQPWFDLSSENNFNVSVLSVNGGVRYFNAYWLHLFVADLHRHFFS